MRYAALRARNQRRSRPWSVGLAALEGNFRRSSLDGVRIAAIAMEDRIVTNAAEVHAAAPGRVNLLGEHTDYNLGLVLPTTIPQQTAVRLIFRPDRRVMASSATVDGIHEYELGQESSGRGWIDYVQGTTAALRARGVSLPGFTLRIDSQVPTGSGLSSSAALLTALLRALRHHPERPRSQPGL